MEVDEGGIVVDTSEMVDFSGFTAVWAKNERACQPDGGHSFR